MNATELVYDLAQLREEEQARPVVADTIVGLYEIAEVRRDVHAGTPGARFVSLVLRRDEFRPEACYTESPIGSRDGFVQALAQVCRRFGANLVADDEGVYSFGTDFWSIECDELATVIDAEAER